MKCDIVVWFLRDELLGTYLPVCTQTGACVHAHVSWALWPDITHIRVSYAVNSKTSTQKVGIVVTLSICI
jgi:hypothetical protein